MQILRPPQHSLPPRCQASATLKLVYAAQPKAGTCEEPRPVMTPSPARLLSPPTLYPSLTRPHPAKHQVRTLKKAERRRSGTWGAPGSIQEGRGGQRGHGLDIERVGPLGMGRTGRGHLGMGKGQGGDFSRWDMRGSAGIMSKGHVKDVADSKEGYNTQRHGRGRTEGSGNKQGWQGGGGTARR